MPPTPRQISQRLITAAQSADPALQQTLLESAQTIEYLLILLQESAMYIESVKEYEHPPRFLYAVRDALAEVDEDNP